MNLQERLSHYRINPAEYEKVKELLGREPKDIEWALFSALWSEHCSYKSSKVHLKKFFNSSPRVLQSFGENAGVIDLGQGEKVAFKMESHNHPSYIEPYQGAATGVGGILRDIFTMGARPIALGNYLCFGQPKADRMATLVDGVVRGIGGYGNCVGVPNITGQTEFDASYDGNILVNAFALGYFGKKDPVVTSKAAGPGNYVVYVGAKTGKDGVHGASMASESFDEESESKKPTVQIGDPFFEKLLIESCLDVIQKDLVVAIQDMGAAGITSSSYEMASNGNVGFKIHLDKVPRRDVSITPEEVLLSESQERMLLVCEPKQFAEVKQAFDRWDLDAEVIGEVIGDRRVELYWEGELLSDLDPHMLTENAPSYERPYNPWVSVNKVENLPWNFNKSGNELLVTFLSDIRGCSRSWIYDQYDQRVGAGTALDCGESVGVIRLPESGRGLAVVLGCRPHIMRVDSQVGGADALVYPALEMSAKGFEPLAITDCLNFGNPEKPELMSEFVAAVESMSRACEAFVTPVISGNVSLYNETLDKNVTSTPSTGVVGLKEDISSIPSSCFVDEGEKVYLLSYCGVTAEGYGSQVLNGAVGKFCGELDVDILSKGAKWLQIQVNGGMVSSSRVSGKFGLGYCLARMSLSGVGVRISDLRFSGEEGLKNLFHEKLYEVVLTSNGAIDGGHLPEGWTLSEIGVTGGKGLKCGDQISLSVNTICEAYNSGWRQNFESLA